MIALLLVLGCSPGTGPGANGPRAELDEARLLEHTQAMTSIGPRNSGMVGEIEAERLIFERFEAAGLKPELAPFVWDAWRPGTATLTVGDQTWEVEAHSPSPRTDLTAPLVDGDADVSGAIALYSSDTGSRAEHFLRAVGGDAAAFLRINDFVDHDGSPLVEVGHTLEGSTLPGVAVDTFVGDALREREGQPATLRIEPDIAVGHTSQNVLARVGPADSARTVYVLAHYDSWYNSEGAFDNALGVGALLSMAERLASGPEPENQVVFIATSGEEQGLQGAFAWVEENRDEVGSTDVAVTLDVLWSGEGSFSCMATTDALRAAAIQHSADEGLEARDGGDPTPASDHFPFVVEGSDAVWCGRWPDRHYHTTQDLLDHLNLTRAAMALRGQWALVAELAGVEP